MSNFSFFPLSVCHSKIEPNKIENSFVIMLTVACSIIVLVRQYIDWDRFERRDTLRNILSGRLETLLLDGYVCVCTSHVWFINWHILLADVQIQRRSRKAHKMKFINHIESLKEGRDENVNMLWKISYNFKKKQNW